MSQAVWQRYSVYTKSIAHGWVSISALQNRNPQVVIIQKVLAVKEQGKATS